MAGSFLALEELFASGDPRFLVELRGTCEPARLKGFAEKWFKDPRTWAKEQLAAYLDMPLNCAGHEPLVKKLFKTAESAADDATMARFMALFDRSVRRSEKKRWRYQDFDIAFRVSKSTLAHEKAGGGQAPKLPRGTTRSRETGRLFTVHTRRYLQRRAWRYFRRLGRRDSARYLAAMKRALALYSDPDCDSGIHFLDNWGLIHALFRYSPVLARQANGWLVKPDQALRDLKPAPAFPKAWTPLDGLDVLVAARARPVRRTMLAMVKGALDKVPIERILSLLEHADEEVQALGAELLRTAGALETLPLEAWLKLLDIKNLSVLEAVCEMMQKSVSPTRLSTEQLLAFACAPLGPVAKLGIDWLKQRPLQPSQILELANVRAASAAADAVAFAKSRLTDPAHIIPFLDSTTEAVRIAAWTWFAEDKASSRLDLWAKLVESPYDDVRISIVRHLERRARTDQALRVLLVQAPLEAVWATVLLNIQRGNRAKRMAASQIADAIEKRPDRAAVLLPLLRVAARSIRAPEFRAGLAAVVRAATRRPELAAAVATHFPELKL